MQEASSSKRITSRCPLCRQQYLVEAAHVGKTVRCRKCGGSFEIAPVSSPAHAAPPGAAGAAGASAGGTLCAVCQTPVKQGEDLVNCPGCNAPYHRECWEYNKGCGVYGCAQVPATEKLDALEVPVSYWGKEEKNCPVCKKVILAAAIRCRHCGATFASARPESALDFSRRMVVEQALPRARKIGIWLLVLSILSCTAPFAAVAGPIWYFSHRREIDALPSLYAALCRIALVVAIAQTALAVLSAIAYGIFG